MEDVCKLALAIADHGRVLLKRDVVEIDTGLGCELRMPIRSDIHNSDCSLGCLGCCSLQEGQEMVREKPVRQIVCLEQSDSVSNF